MSQIMPFRGPARSHTLADIAPVRNVELLDAIVAACALMAHADGEMAAAERRRLFAILRDTVSLSGFSRQDLVDRVAEHEANFRFDPELAQQMAREKLTCIVGQPKPIRLVVAACRAILQADGIVHPSEFRALIEIKALLGDEEG